ncbi:MAG TPA: hypothetical protein VGR91_16425 [Stellaceae bacterium]|nr:hypothetical protein [Stellaceae bacterium]
MPTAAEPNITDFTTWIRNVMRVGAPYLPDGAATIQHAFDQALNIANDDLDQAVAQATSWSPYALAVYNLGGHLLAEYAADQSYAIEGVAWNAGLVMVTTAAPNQIQVGDAVSISGISPNPYNSAPPPKSPTVVYAVADTTHFLYPLQPNPGTGVPGPTATVSEVYFANLRRSLKIASFVPGVVASTSDQGTAMGLSNPDFVKRLTLYDLQLLKSPWGQAYLSMAQKYGPSVWGLS